MSVTDTLLLRSLLLFLMLGSVAGLLAGAALILRPDWLVRASKSANHWVPTRKLNQSLESPINLDHWFYRYRRLSGAFILLGAVYMLYFFMFKFDKSSLLAMLVKNATVPPALMDGLLDGLVLIGLTGAVCALIVSLFLLFRPSMLRSLELGVNQSTSLRRALKPLEIPRSDVDEYVFRHVHLAGVLLLLGSLYTLAGLATWLGNLG